MGSSERIPFLKMQGVGNDFVVVDGRGVVGIAWSGLAVEMCDRRLGVGADGLLVLDRDHDADIAMRMFNPDGTPDICGNGLRCISRFLVERVRGARSGVHNARVATLAGIREVSVDVDHAMVTAEMGHPRFAPAEIPMYHSGDRVINYPLDVAGEPLVITALSTGSTHAIAFVDELPTEEEFQRLSPRVEHHPLFPQRTSLMWTRVDAPDHVTMRIWERGANETWGCGTGACAVAVAGYLTGRTADVVDVQSRGGTLRISWHEDEPIRQTGPAEYVFEGVYPLGLPDTDR